MEEVYVIRLRGVQSASTSDSTASSSADLVRGSVLGLGVLHVTFGVLVLVFGALRTTSGNPEPAESVFGTLFGPLFVATGVCGFLSWRRPFRKLKMKVFFGMAALSLLAAAAFLSVCLLGVVAFHSVPRVFGDTAHVTANAIMAAAGEAAACLASLLTAGGAVWKRFRGTAAPRHPQKVIVKTDILGGQPGDGAGMDEDVVRHVSPHCVISLRAGDEQREVIKRVREYLHAQDELSFTFSDPCSLREEQAEVIGDDDNTQEELESWKNSRNEALSKGVVINGALPASEVCMIAAPPVSNQQVDDSRCTARIKSRQEDHNGSSIITVNHPEDENVYTNSNRQYDSQHTRSSLNPRRFGTQLYEDSGSTIAADHFGIHPPLSRNQQEGNSNCPIYVARVESRQDDYSGSTTEAGHLDDRPEDDNMNINAKRQYASEKEYNTRSIDCGRFDSQHQEDRGSSITTGHLSNHPESMYIDSKRQYGSQKEEDRRSSTDSKRFDGRDQKDSESTIATGHLGNHPVDFDMYMNSKRRYDSQQEEDNKLSADAERFDCRKEVGKGSTVVASRLSSRQKEDSRSMPVSRQSDIQQDYDGSIITDSGLNGHRNYDEISSISAVRPNSQEVNQLEDDRVIVEAMNRNHDGNVVDADKWGSQKRGSTEPERDGPPKTVNRYQDSNDHSGWVKQDPANSSRSASEVDTKRWRYEEQDLGLDSENWRNEVMSVGSASIEENCEIKNSLDFSPYAR